MLFKKTICILILFLFNSMLTHANFISFDVNTYSTRNNLLNTPAPTGEGFQVICYTISPTVEDLEATGSQILWYTTAVGGVPLPSTTTLLNCQVYFASQTIGGIESSQRLAVTVFLIQSVITASETVVCPNATVQLAVTENNFSFEPFTILDFSSSFNSNPSSSSFNGNTLLTQAQAGNFVFNGVPFFIQPWATTLNAWSARYASGSNPRSLVLPTTCRIITDFSLFANTYWGFSGTPALLNVEFYNNNQLVYVKDLVGDDDIRDFNNSASYTSTINNVNTVNYWTSANLNRRLDRINIPLPTPTAVDKIVINDFGATSVQRVFVLATTLHNFQYSVSYLWSTGATTPTISVNPSTTTEYWVDTTVNGQTCRKYITITVSDIVPTFNQVSPICLGSPLSPLPEISTNNISGSWSPPINNSATTTYTFTPNAGQCASITTMTIDVSASITPDFLTNLTLCNNATPPALNTTSPNGITGIWNPSVINATTSGNYVFTPDTGQCGIPITLNVIVTDSSIPDFPENLSLCLGGTPPLLNNISPNGISGSWSPSVINNTTGGSYIFTPIPGQCATNATLVVTINNIVVPDFPTTLDLCSGVIPPILSTISPNGISGSWNPSVINTNSSGSYLFTPSSGQCASTVTLDVTIQAVNGTIIGTNELCEGATSLMTSDVPGGVWSSDNATILSIDQNGTVTGIQPGTTTIKYVVQSSCTLILTKSVSVHALPEPQLGDLFICVDPLSNNNLSSVILNSGLNSATNSFEWSLNGQPLSTTASFHNATQEGIYSVTATNLITGCVGTTSAVVQSSSQAIATSAVGMDFQDNQTITVTVSGGSGAYIYILNDGPQQNSPIFTNIPSGENTIIVRDLNGCDDLILTLFSWQYPKFFTPNGDNVNDIWDISGLENQTDSSLFIFDRYGKLVKSLRPSLGNGWDGTYLGKPLPATDYWFVLHYRDRQGNQKKFNAHFSLKR